MYYYSTVNGIVMEHSAVTEDKNGFDEVDVRFERPNKTGFDFLEMKLPGERIFKAFGFSEDEILKLKRYVKNNAPIIWDFARNGGGENA